MLCSADDFQTFFQLKVLTVQSATTVHSTAAAAVDTSGEVPVQPATSGDQRFPLLTTWHECSAVKSSSLDPIPTFLLQECIDVILSYLTAMVNTSLRCGCLPASQKMAIVTPLLKKAALEPHELKNYRPVSNLSFVSKLVERVAVKQLSDYLETNGLLPLLQSAYGNHHSTETALVKVLSDVLTAIDDKTLLALMDLSAAFDCVDHDILLSRLQSRFGLDGAVLSWIRSFLSDRTQRDCFGGRLSAETLLNLRRSAGIRS